MNLIDIIIIVVYLGGTVAVGILCRGRQQNAEDYFTAGGRMSSVFQSTLVGLSIAATLFSGVSFLMIPSIVYSHGIIFLLCLPGFPISLLLLKFWFLPRYMTGNSQHPYDIIEERLGPGIRTLSAALFIMVRVCWMGALIYAPTLAIMAAMRLSDSWFWPIIFAIGFTSTIYTTLGGIRGVIVTDAIQFVVIAVGIALTIGIALIKLPVSVPEMVDHLHNTGHFEVLNFSLDPTETFTVWSILIGVYIGYFAMYMADQMSLQRYLVAGSVKAASRSFLINVIGVICVLTLLAGVGLALAVWYHFAPDDNLPAEGDKIFPYFVSTQLPTGIAGVLLAAILAATMSSMTSGINTLSATVTFDFQDRFGRKMEPKQQLRFGRVVSLLVGLLSTTVAGLVEHLGTIFDIAQAIQGVFLGPVLTCIIIAVSRIRVNRKSVVVGVVVGLLAGCYVTFSPLANVWTSAATVAVSSAIVLSGTCIFGADEAEAARKS